jgi:transposase InsO family protein
MPWKETAPMEQRMLFIAGLKDGGLTMSEACRVFGVSRKTGYKWLERYKTDGARGLEDQSRAPKTTPWAISDELAETLVKERKARPHWGPQKILDSLRLRRPGLDLPAISTVGELFRRRGLIPEKRRRRKLEKYGTPLAHVQAPNDGWSVDFKGHFLLGNGVRCDPLTVSDGFSRFLLCCRGVNPPTTESVRPWFERTFREFGLPQAIRSDNGPPFSMGGLGGLSRLSVWWAKLGIRLERIRPGRPDQNGRHERMHRTLKAETLRPPAGSMAGQQRRFDIFRQEYNELRPHEALDGQPPASLYEPSQRPFPSKLRAPEYPPHFEVRQVRTDGSIKWRGELIFMNSALVAEPVGLEEIDTDRWLVRFAKVPLAIIDGTKNPAGLIPAPIR